ncbi:MAG: hypothetical protein GPJ54_02780 [Candidatus Heimdallarchaeota archaeon]|nr:hypothetical protein [Candidatus Heimdallarchaeota archaeon]
MIEKSNDESPVGEQNGIWMSLEKVELLEEKISNYSNFQRVSSVFLWIAIVMTLLHILTDVFFHII